MKIREIITVKKLVFIALLGIIGGALLLVRVARQPPELPPGTDPRFGDLLQPLPEPPSEYRPPTSTTVTVPEDTELPATHGVYRQALAADMTARAGQLAGAFDIGGTIQSFDNFLIISDGEKYLRLDTKTGTLTYNQPLPAYLREKDAQALESFAVVLARQAASDPELWKAPQTQAEFFIIRHIHEFEPTSPEKATNATIHVFPSLEERRIVSGRQPPFDRFGPVAVDFDFERKTIILISQQIGVDFSEIGVYPLKTKEVALQELRAGQAFISSIAPEGQPPSLIETGSYQPTTAQFSQIEIVYYYDPTPDALLQPMYLFTGTTSLTDGRKASITALVHAIDPQFIKRP